MYKQRLLLNQTCSIFTKLSSQIQASEQRISQQGYRIIISKELMCKKYALAN